MYENLDGSRWSARENYQQALKAVKRNQGRAGNRSDDDGRTGGASSEALVKIQGEAAEGNLRPEPREAGRNTESRAGANGCWESRRYRIGSSSRLLLQALTPICEPTIQRAQLWVPAGTQRAGCRASRAAVRAGREGLGGGYGHHEVLRPRQSRHSDGADRGSDPGQTGVAADREIPAAGSDGGGGGGKPAWKERRKAGRCHRCWPTSTWMRWIKELERRGHAFCRYADDCNIYVGSQAAAERMLESVQGWIEKHLRLKVNAAKSGTGRAWERKFLGFRLDRERQIEVAPESVETIQRRRCGRCGGAARVAPVTNCGTTGNRYVRGWWGYFRLAESAQPDLADWRDGSAGISASASGCGGTSRQGRERKLRQLGTAGARC